MAAGVSKTDALMQAIGDVDEANSALGVAIATLGDHPVAVALRADLQMVQNDLFDLGADLATPGDDFAPSGDDVADRAGAGRAA